MSDHPAIREFIQGTIRAEKARQGITFTELSNALMAFGIDQTSTNLSTKVGRGNMSAQLFLAIMKVLNQQDLHLDALQLAKPRRAKAAVAAPAKANGTKAKVAVEKKMPPPIKKAAPAKAKRAARV